MARRWTTWLAAVVIVVVCTSCAGNSPRSAPACPPADAGPTAAPAGGATLPAATPPTVAPPPAPAGAPAALALAVTPSAVVLDGLEPQPVVVAVTDTGGGRIDNLSVALSPPAGVVWRPESAVDRLTLGPQDRLVVRGTLVGRRTVGGSTSVVAEGRAVDTGRTVVEVTTVDHQPAPPLATLTVTGGDKLSNSRNLDLLAVVTNAGDGPVVATVHGSSTNPGKAKVSVACPQVVGAGDAAVFAVTVDGADLRSGSETATVTADIGAGGPTEHLVATHAFDTSPFGDTSLVGPLGLSSLLLLPGIAAVLTWSVLRVYPRRRRGVVTSALPDLRSLGTAISVVLASAGAIEAYRLLGGESLYDGYSTWSLAVVTVLAWLAALVAGAIRWFSIEQRYPVLDADAESDARDALAALRSWSLPADTVEGVHGRIVWVHDGAACAVSGIQVRGTIAGPALDDAVARKDLRQLQRIVKDNPALVVGYVPDAAPGEGPTLAGARTGAVKEDFRPQGRAPVISYSVTV